MKGTVMRALRIPLFALVLFGVVPAFAQGEVGSEPGSAGETAAVERAAQFVGVTGPDTEDVPGGPLLITAYAVVWGLLFLFLLRMRGLQRETAEELERLAAEVRAAEGR